MSSTEHVMMGGIRVGGSCESRRLCQSACNFGDGVLHMIRSETASAASAVASSCSAKVRKELEPVYLSTTITITITIIIIITQLLSTLHSRPGREQYPGHGDPS